MGKRKPRLPFTEGTPSVVVPPDDRRWQAVERAYGHELSEGVRREIAEKVAHFIERRGGELNAEPVADALQRVDRIGKALDALSDAMIDEGSDANFACDSALDRAIAQILSDRPSISFRNLIFMLIRATARAERELKSMETQGNFESGGEFRNFVVKTTDILEKYGLSTTINKGLRPNGDDADSAFVQLVEAIQQEFVPSDHRQHMHSRAALAKAMSDARRAVVSPRDRSTSE